MWPQLIIMVVMMVAAYAMMASMGNTTTDPSASSTLDVPTAEEGGNIPVVFGTNLLRATNVIWYGDPRVVAIKQKGSGK